MKQPRLVDEELLEAVRHLPCIICLHSPCEPHHVTTRGAGGDDVATNLMPLCFVHHHEWHLKGPGYMIESHPSIKHWLELAGRDDVFLRANRSSK